MKAAVLAIGDELLIGQVVNSNQAYIAQRLNSVGISVEKMLTVGDLMGDVLQAFRECWSAYQVVIVTGGLGPTHDDITKKAVCAFFDTGLVSRPDLRESILTMASHAETSVRNAVQALMARDETLALKVRQDEDIIDRFEVQVDEMSIHLLAKAPLATNLRLIAVAMKISQNLERVGDEASMRSV